MWLTVEQTTRYVYDAPINEAYTEVRLKPLHRDGQRCSSFTLTTEPRGATVDEYVDRYGNTSAASIPIALDEALEQGKLREGSTALLVAFGAGFTWGAGIVEWGIA